MKRIIVIGGGAAGIFSAIAAASEHPDAEVSVLERTATLLAKVRISGGGRCNVTHACFDPKKLIQNYPRGGKELLGPFTRFQPKDTIEWFETKKVSLKVEEDGRMFPTTDQSQTIIDCLLKESSTKGVNIRLNQRIEEVKKIEDHFVLIFADGHEEIADKLILATGSAPQGHRLAAFLGHAIIDPVPSLFTFNVPTSPLLELSGISVEKVTLRLGGTAFEQTGPLLLTHWGFSGPAALKLSAWSARYLHACNYHTPLEIQWLYGENPERVFQKLSKLKEEHPQTFISAYPLGQLPKNLWKKLLSPDRLLGSISQKELRHLSERLCRDVYMIEGKTTYKQEFVTCGGVSLKEVNFQTMESKLCPGLYFAGEVLDIDGVTGGFNFQAAWTTAWIAGKSTR